MLGIILSDVKLSLQFLAALAGLGFGVFKVLEGKWRLGVGVIAAVLLIVEAMQI